jgi:hypothetical protein
VFRVASERALYDDGRIELDQGGITIRRYYFPFGASKHIPYGRIRDVQERRLTATFGKGRLWGSGDLRHWVPLDLRRPWREKALVLTVGTWVQPVITPDDPDRVLAILRDRAL